jgi:hypothetical protein
VCAQERTVLRVVGADFFFNCCYIEIPVDIFGTYQSAFTIMRKVFDWKRSSTSVMDDEAISQSYNP